MALLALNRALSSWRERGTRGVPHAGHVHLATNANSPKLARPGIALARKVDPAGILPLQRRLTRELERRFRLLKQDIEKSIIDDDCFGIISPTFKAPLAFNKSVGARFEFATDPEKIQRFMDWLRGQEASGILDIKHISDHGIATIPEWSNVYVDTYHQKAIREAYLKGVGKADVEAAKLLGAKAGPIAVGFNQPVHAEAIGMIYSRTYEDLKSVLDVQNAAIRREIADGLSSGLARGLAEGKQPKAIARALVKNVTQHVDKIGINRARMIARTETARAHSTAMLREFKQAGMEGVEIDAEWLAGVGACPICAELHGKAFSLKEAEGMLPAHPYCRCTFIPRIVGVPKSKEDGVRRERKFKQEPRPRKVRAIKRTTVQSPAQLQTPTPPSVPSGPPKPTSAYGGEITSRAWEAEGFLKKAERRANALDRYVNRARKTRTIAHDRLDKAWDALFDRAGQLGESVHQADIGEVADLLMNHEATVEAMLAKYATGDGPLVSEWREFILAWKDTNRANAMVERALTQQFSGSRMAMRLLNEKSPGKFASHVIGPGTPTPVSAVTKRLADVVDQSLSDVASLVHRQHPVLNVELKFEVGDNIRARAWCGLRANPVIELDASNTADVVAHEIGHFVETRSLGGVQACDAWRIERKGSEAYQSLNALKGTTRFEQNEFAFRDKLLDEYIGKDYGGQLSEVVSMGVQYLVTDPVWFAKNDPDMFNFVVSILKGIPYKKVP